MEDQVTTPTTTPLWNWISLGLFVLAFPVGLIMSDVGSSSNRQCGTLGLDCAFNSFLVAGAVFLGGAIAACIALARAEQLPWLSGIAFFLNVIPTLLAFLVLLRIFIR
jgi:hypothetical protein